MEVISLGITSS